MIRLKQLLRALGFYHFRWFRRWHGGTWHKEYGLLHAIRTGVFHKNPTVYMTKDFRVISDVEKWPDKGVPYENEA